MHAERGLKEIVEVGRELRIGALDADVDVEPEVETLARLLRQPEANSGAGIFAADDQNIFAAYAKSEGGGEARIQFCAEIMSNAQQLQFLRESHVPAEFRGQLHRERSVDFAQQPG